MAQQACHLAMELHEHVLAHRSVAFERLLVTPRSVEPHQAGR